MSDDITGPLREIKALLEDAGIADMIVGSFASTIHGEPRTTHDLDIVIDPSSAALDYFLAHVDMEAFYVDPGRRAMRYAGGQCSTSSTCVARGRSTP